MVEENMNQEFRQKSKEQTRNYFVKGIEENELMSMKYKKVCSILNYTQNFPILASTVTGCISISDFASLLGTPIGVTSYAVG